MKIKDKSGKVIMEKDRRGNITVPFTGKIKVPSGKFGQGVEKKVSSLAPYEMIEIMAREAAEGMDMQGLIDCSIQQETEHFSKMTTKEVKEAFKRHMQDFHAGSLVGGPYAS